MDDLAYIPTTTAHPMHDTLTVRSAHSRETHSSVTPSSSGYGPQDMTRSYTVPPFSPYQAYDTSLPTPISVSGSPPLSERSYKMPPSYDQHEERGQALTPPAGPRAWPYGPMSGASPGSMTVPTTASEVLNGHAMDPTNSPGQQPAAPNPTPHFNWGHYTVSSHDASDDMPPGHAMFAPNMPSSVLVRPPHYGMPGTHVSLPPGVPHGSMPPDGTGPQQLMSHTMPPPYGNDLSNIDFSYGQAYPSKKNGEGKPSRSARPAKKTRSTRPGSSRDNNGDDYNDEGASALADNALHGDLQGAAPAPPPRSLELKPDAPEDGRFLVEMRCRMRAEKGKGIWDHIQHAYLREFGREKTRENLQMLSIRTVQKYGIWPADEIQALKLAVEEVDRTRYTKIREIMKEKGGRQVWDWNEGCIAKQLVMLGIDEVDNSCPRKVRRKRKYAARETSGGDTWTAAPNNAFNAEPRVLTQEEDEMILQGFSNPQMMGVAGNSPPASSPGPDRSTRVAKQACEQMMVRQGEQAYTNGHGQYVS
ncbi:hypothetical protein F5Y17DRAFT_468316 [Xylariaceae sp. FL0594]|nr:hypothetical protein F5Y17DRAFT_468316 [Xylariaceae sp. FL0594]